MFCVEPVEFLSLTSEKLEVGGENMCSCLKHFPLIVRFPVFTAEHYYRSDEGGAEDVPVQETRRGSTKVEEVCQHLPSAP